MSGPQLVSAVVREVVQTVGANVVTNFNQIDITFDEQVNLAEAMTVTNYQLVRWESRALIPLVSAQVSFPVVRLTVDTNTPGVWLYRSNYFLCVTNVTDSRGNPIEPHSYIGVSWRLTTNLMPMSAGWKYYDSASIATAPFENQQWKEVNYIADLSWGDGAGVFASGINIGQLCPLSAVGTGPDYQREPILYRGYFVLLSTASRNGTLRLRHFIDDGAVFYLNGKEIYRYNVGNPGSAVTIDTRALTNISPMCHTNIDVTVTNLNPGLNLLAVAVCDGPSIDYETAFGVEVDHTPLQTGPAPFSNRFSSIKRNGNAITLHWANTDAVLLTSTNVVQPRKLWTRIPGAKSPYTIPITNVSQFYGLRLP